MPKNTTHGNPLTAVMEDYLEAIYHIAAGNDGIARPTQISQNLNVHRSTVTTALHTLQKLGFIEYAPYRDIKLTPEGSREAKGIIRRHDTLYRLLHTLLGVEKDEAAKLACEMEHTLDPAIADKFIALVEKALHKHEASKKGGKKP
jgi:DtxR family Mn-dependent transcriptional regulator